MHRDIPFYLNQLKYVTSLYDENSSNDGLFLCPICFNRFSFEMLSREHVPPQSLGGKKIVFTCLKCNNTAGHTIEGHLKSALEYFKNKHFPYGSEVHVKIDFGQKTSFKGTVKRKSEDKFEIFVNERRNNPKVIEDFNKKIKTGADKIVINPITRQKILDTKVIISLIKTAYLQLFWRFGYIPIYDSYFQPLREQIMDPNKIIYPLELCYLNDEDMLMKDEVNIFIFRELKFFISSFDLIFEGITRKFNIIIPLLYTKNGIGCDASYLYYFLKAYTKGEVVAGNTISDVPRPVLNDDTVPTSNFLIDMFY